MWYLSDHTAKYELVGYILFYQITHTPTCLGPIATVVKWKWNSKARFPVGTSWEGARGLYTTHASPWLIRHTYLYVLSIHVTHVAHRWGLLINDIQRVEEQHPPRILVCICINNFVIVKADISMDVEEDERVDTNRSRMYTNNRPTTSTRHWVVGMTLQR